MQTLPNGADSCRRIAAPRVEHNIGAFSSPPTDFEKWSAINPLPKSRPCVTTKNGRAMFDPVIAGQQLRTQSQRYLALGGCARFRLPRVRGPSSCRAPARARSSHRIVRATAAAKPDTGDPEPEAPSRDRALSIVRAIDELEAEGLVLDRLARTLLIAGLVRELSTGSPS